MKKCDVHLQSLLNQTLHNENSFKLETVPCLYYQVVLAT